MHGVQILLIFTVHLLYHLYCALREGGINQTDNACMYKESLANKAV